MVIKLVDYPVGEWFTYQYSVERLCTSNALIHTVCHPNTHPNSHRQSPPAGQSHLIDGGHLVKNIISRFFTFRHVQCSIALASVNVKKYR